MNISNEQFKQERLQAIISDRHSGAAELGRLALQALADYSQICDKSDTPGLLQDMLIFGEALKEARPSMATIVNLVDSWCEWLKNEHESDPDQFRAIALNTALDLLNQSADAINQIAHHVVDLIDEDSIVLTHSYSSTVMACFQALASKGVRAIVTESRPGDEGLRVAQKLVEYAISTEYITDAQLGLFVPLSHAILIGADSILADGSVVNKAGTKLIALAAKDAGIPLYVCTESFKRSQQNFDEVQLEEMDGSELGVPHLPHVTTRNIYFDITPPELITAWINEHGINHS
ncbi:MAG: translation initiation factor eIF-2B [Gammaproteobacteria bacterium]|nr:translation initiation factor eIF-2B [Gammaproteobacteria bacterium]